jgi:hypothetical protein
MNEMTYKQKSQVEKRMKSAAKKLRQFKTRSIPIWVPVIWILIQRRKLYMQRLRKRMKRRALEIGAHQ